MNLGPISVFLLNLTKCSSLLFTFSESQFLVSLSFLYKKFFFSLILSLIFIIYFPSSNFEFCLFSFLVHFHVRIVSLRFFFSIPEIDLYHCNFLLEQLLFHLTDFGSYAFVCICLRVFFKISSLIFFSVIYWLFSSILFIHHMFVCVWFFFFFAVFCL